jgi:hypothetical protein
MASAGLCCSDSNAGWGSDALLRRLTRTKPFDALNAPMKRVSLRTPIAPTPRLTLWVPVLLALGLTLFWLGILALIRI